MLPGAVETIGSELTVVTDKKVTEKPYCCKFIAVTHMLCESE